MKAIVCDICGKKMTDNSFNSYVNVYMRKKGFMPREYDVCSTCFKAFEKWARTYVETEESEG